jgi:O-antigen ligase
MNPSIATLIYACGIAGLFYLGRDKTIQTSKALWLPVAYLWIVGSRGPSIWLGLSPPAGTDVQLDGTPLDRMIFTSILFLGVIVLVQRGSRVLRVVRANWPILAFFAFCLASVVWSDFPQVAAKRWIKAIGDLVMVLIVVTDINNPIGAFKRLISRVGFVLLPASVLLIKYYPGLGRSYDAFVGTQFNTGVTTNKNTLGVVVLVVSLGALWCFLDLLRSKELPNRRRLLLAWGTLLAFGILLLVRANSATSRGCFALGALILVATRFQAVKRHPRLFQVMVLLIVVGGGLATLFGGEIAHAVGRNGDLTGRTEIWNVLVPMSPNPAIGAGFESFWLGDRLFEVREAFRGNPLNEAHNGYIEIYLNLGWIGLSLLALVLIMGFRRASAAFRLEPMFGNLLLAYVSVSVIYSVTEAGFRMLDPIWIFLLLAIVASSAVTSRVIQTADAGSVKLASPSIAGFSAVRTEPRRRAS